MTVENQKVCFYCIDKTFEGVIICPTCRYRYDHAKKELERHKIMYAREKAICFRLMKENQGLRGALAKLEKQPKKPKNP